MRHAITDTAMSLVLFAMTSYAGVSEAQAQVATTAPIIVSGTGTRLDVTTGGTPIVNIATPNAEGVSHNIFSKFNVGQEGAVVNNSTAIVQTVIAGQVLANPNLKPKNTAATLIINEVRGGARSDLIGTIEIAGSRAGLILANPAGITCGSATALITRSIMTARHGRRLR